MQKLINVIIAISIIVILTNCKENPELPSKLKQGFTLYELMVQDNSNSAILCSSTNRIMNNLGQFTDSYQNAAYFYKSDETTAEVAQVKLNNNILNDLLADRGSNLFNGVTQHIWEINGTSDFPSFLDTITSVSSFSIVSPTPGVSQISKSQGVIINYTNIPNIDSLYVVIETNSIISHYLDTNISKTEISQYNMSKVPNTGSINLPPSFFNSINSNRYAKIMIIAYRFKESLKEGKNIYTYNVSACTANYKIIN